MTDHYPDWFDRHKFEKILAIIDSNKFNYKNKMGEFKYNGIRDLVNNIRDNTIGEISAKKGLNKLNEIKNAGIIKYKKCTPKQKELLNLFNNLLEVILTDETLMSSKDENEKEHKNENDKTLMSSNEEDDDDENENDNENEDDDETISQNEKNIKIKELNDALDEIIDKSKSFEDQIKSVRKVENIGEYYFSNNFGDKGLKFKYFKLKLAHLTNNIDEKLFEQIFGHKFQTVNKLINTTNKEEMDSFNNFVIQPSEGHVDVTDAINVILKFNEEI